MYRVVYNIVVLPLHYFPLGLYMTSRMVVEKGNIILLIMIMLNVNNIYIPTSAKRRSSRWSVSPRTAVAIDTYNIAYI